jgi:hypothetical protein
MGVPTVFLVGEERLALVPEYLNLGSVVVIAPDQSTLRSWQAEQLDVGATHSSELAPVGTVVDMEGRRIVTSGASLPLSELEFRVLGALLKTRGRAWSFAELRRVGWGDGPDLPLDPYTVKALVQRMRAKLASASAEFTIEAVRGFGFRIAELHDDESRLASAEPRPPQLSSWETTVANHERS